MYVLPRALPIQKATVRLAARLWVKGRRIDSSAGRLPRTRDVADDNSHCSSDAMPLL
jgi:hypothetical protein